MKLRPKDPCIMQLAPSADPHPSTPHGVNALTERYYALKRIMAENKKHSLSSRKLKRIPSPLLKVMILPENRIRQKNRQSRLSLQNEIRLLTEKWLSLMPTMRKQLICGHYTYKLNKNGLGYCRTHKANYATQILCMYATYRQREFVDHLNLREFVVKNLRWQHPKIKCDKKTRNEVTMTGIYCIHKWSDWLMDGKVNRQTCNYCKSERQPNEEAPKIVIGYFEWTYPRNDCAKKWTMTSN